MMYSPELVIVLNEIAQNKATEFQSVLVNLLSKPPYRNTGEGVNSVTIEITAGTASKAPEIKINFADHLLFMDKRKMQWVKLPLVSKLMTWAATKTDDPKQQKRMAWAIAYDRQKNDSHKAKPWRKKSLSVTLKEMNQQIVAAFDKAIEQSFQNATQL
jgi:hypothetical protein